MKKITLIVFLWTGLGACLAENKFRKTDFMYSSDSRSYRMSIIVPKGYTRERTEVDSSGNTILSYLYEAKAIFYVAHLEDTSTRLQPLKKGRDTSRIDSATGMVVYQGQDTVSVFWKEARMQNFCTGYRNVSQRSKSRFDSAVSYCAAQALSGTKF